MGMNLSLCTVIVPEEALDALTAALAQHVAFGWEEESLPTGETRVRVHCENSEFIDTLAVALRAVPGADVRVESVSVVDWTEAWREYFTPVTCGSCFVVLPPWLTDAPEATGRTPVIIEPRSAFGTGHHATTALCLAALADVLDTGRVRAGMRFLDIGTGSGVLAIACCRAGLAGAGVDIDQLSLENARENAGLNAVAFDVLLGSVEAAPEGTYDLVLANILAAPLRDMAADIAARVEKSGCLILSGILDVQADDVAAAYTVQGMTLAHRYSEGDWVALLLTW